MGDRRLRALTVMAGAILGPITNEIRVALEVSPSLASLIITTHGLFIVLCSHSLVR